MPTFVSETTLDLTDRDAAWARIADRDERGDRVAAIAEQEGVCIKTVRTIARRRGIPRRRPDQRERDARSMFDGDGSGGPRRAAGRPRLDWYGTRAVMEQCSAFWGARLALQTGRAPRVVAHSGGLSKIALYGSNAARAARILLDASPISMDRKRRTLEEIVHYRPHGRPVAGRSTTPRRPTWQPQI